MTSANLFLNSVLALPRWFALDPLLPYITGGSVLISGLIVLFKTEVPRSRGLDKLVVFGPLFMGAPMAVFGADHFLAGPLLTPMIPGWIPLKLFWVYFVGACLIAGGFSLATKIRAGLTAALFGIMILCFEALISIPAVVAAPGNRVVWAVALRDLSFCGGALALAATYTDEWKKNGTYWLITAGRFFLAIPILFFVVEQFLHPEFVPAVPLARLTPAYIPVRLLWGYLSAIVYLLLGISLLINKRVRLASSWLGLYVLAIVMLVYLPILIADASDIANGINYFADTLLLSGSALCLAASQRAEMAAHGGLHATETQGLAAD